MKDVREQLQELLGKLHDGYLSMEEVLDRIDARFEVQAKPVVTAAELGQLVTDAYGISNLLDGHRGERMLEFLGEAKLQIVRIDEAGEGGR